jgi:NADH dehydrogenase/NADH:ubiquinone oxidoreductase subunit G
MPEKSKSETVMFNPVIPRTVDLTKPRLRDMGPCLEYMDRCMICTRCGKTAKESVEGKPCP